MAARRGVKGFSALVEEALDRYFAAEEERLESVRKALGVLGGLPDEEADRLERDVGRLRRSWR